MTILAIDPTRTTNAALMVACRDLGYLGDDVLDPTYGTGRFWIDWRPARLVASDLDPAKSPLGRAVDFCDLPWATRQFPSVVFDPPYKLNGTGGSHASDEGYGVAGSVTLADKLALIRDGVIECARVTRPDGHLLVKSQDQVCSGVVQWQTDLVTEVARQHGCVKVDRFDLLGHRPQPAGRRQVHARRNHSTLLVFRKIADEISSSASADESNQ